MRSQEELKSIVKSLCADDIEFLLNYLPSLQTSKNSNHKIITRERKALKCPKCNSTHYLKNGHTKYNRQKYICKECKNCFSDSNDSIIYHSRSTYDQWITFIDCEIHGNTIAETANKVGKSNTTIFSWRHKLYAAIETVLKSIVLEGEIQIDAKYVSINLKGTKLGNMPRYSKRRSNSAYRGISHHKVCIISAVDENDNMFFEITGLGSETNEMMKKIAHKISKCSVLISDGKFSYQTFCKELNCRSELIKSGTHINENGYHLNTINGLHSELERELNKRKGVSIKHLQGYLNMFVFKKMLTYTTDMKLKDIVTYNKVIPSNTKKYIKEIFEKALPINLAEAYAEYNYGIFKK